MQRLKRPTTETDTNGSDFILTHIEDDREIVELLDLGIDYGQGFLFGKPAPGKIPSPAQK